MKADKEPEPGSTLPGARAEPRAAEASTGGQPSSPVPPQPGQHPPCPGAGGDLWLKEGVKGPRAGCSAGGGFPCAHPSHPL